MSFFLTIIVRINFFHIHVSYVHKKNIDTRNNLQVCNQIVVSALILYFIFLFITTRIEKKLLFSGFIASFCGFVLALLHHSFYFIRNFIVYAVITHHHHKLLYVKLASYFQREKKASKDNKHKIKNNNNEYYDILSFYHAFQCVERWK